VADIDYKQIKEELLNRIRNADVLTISERGVTTTTDSFNGDNIQTQFTLTNSGIKNIREVRVDTNIQTPLVDYTYTLTETDENNKVITFTTPPGVGILNVEIDYDYSSSGDKIYDDFPLAEISIDSYPRIGFEIISDNTTLESFNRQLYQTELLISFQAFGVGRNATEDILSNLRQHLMDNRNNLVRLTYIEPRGRSRILSVESTNGKIFKRTTDFAAPFEFEEG